jgi:hypothetical protein
VADAAAASWDPTPLAVVYINNYLDQAVPFLGGGQVVYYRIVGGDYCDNDSDPSAPAKLECAFSGDVDFVRPTDGQRFSGTVATTVTAPSCSDCTGATITYTHSVNGVVRRFNSSTAGSSWTDTAWSAVPYGDYTITAAVTNQAGCVATQTVFVTVTAPPPTGP